MGVPDAAVARVGAMESEALFTLSDVEARAQAALDPVWWGYFAGGAGNERTLRANVAAFARRGLRPRVLCGIEAVSTSTLVLGQELAFPVLVAPVAYQRLVHPEGEEAMARAAAGAGAGYCLSTLASSTPAAVAAAAPGGVRFHQVYVFRDRGVTDELVAQALEAGFSALVLTVDLPVPGPRDRERDVSAPYPVDELPAIRYARTRGIAHKGLSLIDPALDWAYLERLCASVPVPVVVKGVLEPEDAVLAAEHGAAAVVVSNHGGRQLDGAAATLEALPGIVEALDGRIEVLLDGGVRRGVDVAVALALGARAVLVGRLPIFGLAAGGEAGARRALELLRAELGTALHLSGCRSPADLGPRCLRPPWP